MQQTFKPLFFVQIESDELHPYKWTHIWLNGGPQPPETYGLWPQPAITFLLYF